MSDIRFQISEVDVGVLDFKESRAKNQEPRIKNKEPK